MTTANLPSDSPLAATAAELQALIENLIELGVLVHDNQGTPQSHSALVHKTTHLVEQLSTLEAARDTADYPIPIDVISYIEDGRNPDVYTREFVELTAKSNARLKGKMQLFALLRDVLGAKLAAEFPRLAPAIEDIKMRSTES
jgi:mediator of RNA polymerase II transcription subunit 10